MATNKKPAPGKTFTKKVTVEKQTNFNARTGTADMRGKAKPAPKAAKPIIGRTSQDPKIKAQLAAKVQKAPTKKQGGSAPKVSKDMTKPIKGNKGVGGAVANRVKTVAREAKDIVGAAKAVGKAAGSVARGGDTYALKNVAKDFPRQVGEIARAAVTGKPGTKPSKVYTGAQSHRTKGATNSVPQQRGRR
jgi:hypothetical protein